MLYRAQLMCVRRLIPGFFVVTVALGLAELCSGAFRGYCFLEAFTHAFSIAAMPTNGGVSLQSPCQSSARLN